MAEVNPYRPPASHVDDVFTPAADGRNFIAGGRRVPAGHGWTWIKEGWSLFKQQPGTWILIVLLVWVISVAVSLVPLLGIIVPSIIFPGLLGGIILGCKAMDEGNRLTVAHLFSAFQVRGGALLLLGLAEFVLYLVAMIPFLLVIGTRVAAAMMGGNLAALADIGLDVQLAFLVSLALILPVLAASWFAAVLVTLHDVSPLAALWTSLVACLKNIIPFLLNGFIFLLLGILALIPLGLGLLVLVPVLFATDYSSYRDIFFEGSTAVTEFQ